MMDTKRAALVLMIAVVCGATGVYSGTKGPAAAAPPAPSAAGTALQANSGAATGGAAVKVSLDFEAYRSRVEPIFLKKRQAGVRCYDCHSILPTRLRLEPMSTGSSSWTEEQSRRNFATVSQLVVPSNPLKSALLVHPLAQDAGGDPMHTGGKFWASQNDPEWKMLADWVRSGAPVATAAAASVPATLPALDVEFFKTRVEPIFLKERPEHARCYVCHTEANRIFRLEELSPGSAAWTDEQSLRNFQSAVRQVVPGDPASSRLLTHALAPEAGGEPFHSGGRQFPSQNDPDWLTLAEWVRGSRTGAASENSSAGVARIYITNSASDTIDVIDPVTNKVVQVIRGIELPHGVNFSPDGARVYVSNESESVLDVVDRKSGEILQKVPLSGRPNNLTVTKDGKRVLVGIRFGPAVLDVIDTTTFRLVKSIPVHGNVHNVYVTPDGKYVVSGSLDSKFLTVVNLGTDQAVWDLNLGSGVRPMAFETNADGSTSRIFVQLSNLHGFAVVDFVKRAEVARIKLPDEPSGFGIAEGRIGTPSHGIGVAPDGKSLWVNSSLANAVFEYSLPDLKLVGHVALSEVHSLAGTLTGVVPEWITFTPDSKFVYVSNSGARLVSAIDAQTLKEIARIPVGEVPKRVNTLVLHTD